MPLVPIHCRLRNEITCFSIASTFQVVGFQHLDQRICSLAMLNAGRVNINLGKGFAALIYTITVHLYSIYENRPPRSSVVELRLGMLSIFTIQFSFPLAVEPPILVRGTDSRQV